MLRQGRKGRGMSMFCQGRLPAAQAQGVARPASCMRGRRGCQSKVQRRSVQVSHAIRHCKSYTTENLHQVFVHQVSFRL